MSCGGGGGGGGGCCPCAMQFNKWFTWVMVVGFVITAGMWVFLLDKVQSL